MAGVCSFDDVAEGTPLARQTAGDCSVWICDGLGNVSEIADVQDIEDDGVQCTLDTCDGKTPVHTPGMTACYSGAPGTAGIGACTSGAQMCDIQGDPVGPCVGEVLPQPETCELALVDEDCDGAVNEDGAGCVCMPASEAPCYSGAADTLDVGACHGGVHTCADHGLGFGECVGEALPGLEDCDVGDVDEDCDGEVNEAGPSCTCGDGDVSAGEVCDDGNKLDGDGCSADCKQALVVLKVALGVSHACALLTGGKVKCWGTNLSGQLGLGDVLARGDQPGEMGAALPFVDLGPGQVAVELSLGGTHSCARLVGGQVKCWGGNDYGQLGLGDTLARGDQPGEMGAALPAVNIGAAAISLSVGDHYACALLDDGQVKCWGLNMNGELGRGDTASRGDGPGEMGNALLAVPLAAGQTVIALSAGGYHNCALLSGGGLKCWGGNNGELGIGDGDNRGDQPGEMGAALPFVDLAPNKPVSVSAGGSTTCALMDDKSVRCWGLGGYIGLGDKLTRGDNPGEMGLALPAVDLGAPALAVHSGGHHCALFAGGKIKCWGWNVAGQLGLGDVADRGDQPGEMGDALPFVSLGAGKTVVDLEVVNRTACALLNDGTIKCWGQNNQGQLGQGDKNNRGDAPGEMGDALPPVKLF